MNRKCANLEVHALALGILQKFQNICHRVEMRKAVTSSPNFQCCLRIDFTHLRACDRFQNLRVTRWSHAHAKKKQSNDCQNKTHIKILQQGTQALFILSVAHLRSQTRGLLSAPRLHTNFPLRVEQMARISSRICGNQVSYGASHTFQIPHRYGLTLFCHMLASNTSAQEDVFHRYLHGFWPLISEST